MSDSPFADNANALLTFKVATGLTQEDPRTGNPIPIVGTVEIKAMLQRPKLNPKNLAMTGLDQTEAPLEGRAVDPQYLPSSIQIGARAECAIVDLFTGTEQLGEFVITSIQQSAFAVVTEVLGSVFEGRFKADNAGEVLYET
jgi:hypothetical protein